MSTNITGDWHELFDVALFEPNKTRLRQRIAQAKDAIHNRLDALTLDANREAHGNDQSESGRVIAERIALSDALTTLAELHKMVYARKPGASARHEAERAAGQDSQ